MKSLFKITIFALLVLGLNNSNAQDLAVQQKYTAHNKGKFFISFISATTGIKPELMAMS